MSLPDDFKIAQALVAQNDVARRAANSPQIEWLAAKDGFWSGIYHPQSGPSVDVFISAPSGKRTEFEIYFGATEKVGTKKSIEDAKAFAQQYIDEGRLEHHMQNDWKKPTKMMKQVIELLEEADGIRLEARKILELALGGAQVQLSDHQLSRLMSDELPRGQTLKQLQEVRRENLMAAATVVEDQQQQNTRAARKGR